MSIQRVQDMMPVAFEIDYEGDPDREYVMLVGTVMGKLCEGVMNNVSKSDIDAAAASLVIATLTHYARIGISFEEVLTEHMNEVLTQNRAHGRIVDGELITLPDDYYQLRTGDDHLYRKLINATSDDVIMVEMSWPTWNRLRADDVDQVMNDDEYLFNDVDVGNIEDDGVINLIRT